MHPADCRTALQKLEAARPGSDDLHDPELAAAAAHLRAHPECAERFEMRQALDREIGRVMRDVPVPAGLKERLLTQLIESEASVPAAATRSRRRVVWGAVSVVAACLLLAAIGWWLAPGWSSGTTMANLRDAAKQADEHYATLPALPAGTEARLPEFGWRRRSLALAAEPRAITPHGSRQPLAAYRFELVGRGVSGVLLVVPAARVSDPPRAHAFTRDSVHYDGPRSLVSWTDGDRVYICVVRGPADAVERLHHALSVHAAA